jgi:hypothetical protein
LTVMESGNVADTPLASVTSTVKDLVTGRGIEGEPSWERTHRQRPR